MANEGVDHGRRRFLTATTAVVGGAGVVAVAVPVFDESGRVVAALNSSSHSKKITEPELVRERLGLLREISGQISSELRRIPGLALSAQS